MDMRLTRPDSDLANKARAFTEQILIPLEDECETNDGLSPESHAAAKQAVLDWNFNAINHAPENGGQGLDLFQQMLVEEQWGQATGALWDIPGAPASPWRVVRKIRRSGSCVPPPAASAARPMPSPRRERALTRPW